MTNYHIDQRNNHGKINQTFNINAKPLLEYITLENYTVGFLIVGMAAILFKSILFHCPFIPTIVETFSFFIGMALFVLDVKFANFAATKITSAVKSIYHAIACPPTSSN